MSQLSVFLLLFLIYSVYFVFEKAAQLTVLLVCHCRIHLPPEEAQHIPQGRMAWTRHDSSRKMPPSAPLLLHLPAVLLPPNPKSLALMKSLLLLFQSPIPLLHELMHLPLAVILLLD